MQSKKNSIIEVTSGAMIKFLATLPFQMFIVFPMFEVEVEWTVNVGIWISMTVFTITITYFIRRWFTKRT